VRAFCVSALAAALCFAFPASAARSRVVWADWPDNRHGWVGCGENALCSTEDGGRTWRKIFKGGNYLFGYHRSSATAGVLEAGNWHGAVLWTRDNGRTWYVLPNINGGGYRDGLPGPVVEGRDSFLFWHHSGRVLSQLTGWPADRNPPCIADHSMGRPVCLIPLSESPFESTAVATIPSGRLDAMTNLPGGVAALVIDDRAEPAPGFFTGLPVAVLVRRKSESRFIPLPPSALPERNITCTWLAAAWPKLFVVAGKTYGTWRPCERTPHAFWLSRDGGDHWELRSTKITGRRTTAVAGGQIGSKVAVPGGWIAALQGVPARLAVRTLGHVRRFALPLTKGCRVSAARPVVDWPRIFVLGRAVAGTTSIRWWSADGGATWDVYGRC
jgi:hypothetical protein